MIRGAQDAREAIKTVINIFRHCPKIYMPLDLHATGLQFLKAGGNAGNLTEHSLNSWHFLFPMVELVRNRKTKAHTLGPRDSGPMGFN